MAYSLSLSRRTARFAPGGSRVPGVLSSARAYAAAHGAAMRTTVAVSGRNRPSEPDLKTLGIEDTAAYAAVTRH